MTGYTVHTGATEKFVAGWDEIFKKRSKGKGAPTKKKQAAVKKKATKKVAGTKGRKAMKRKK